jgi:hypothetical protein
VIGVQGTERRAVRPHFHLAQRGPDQAGLTRIWVRDQVHDGEKMGGDCYQVPRYPVAPGAEVPKEDFVIIESVPVKSIITFPGDRNQGRGWIDPGPGPCLGRRPQS